MHDYFMRASCALCLKSILGIQNLFLSSTNGVTRRQKWYMNASPRKCNWQHSAHLKTSGVVNCNKRPKDALLKYLILITVPVKNKLHIDLSLTINYFFCIKAILKFHCDKSH